MSQTHVSFLKNRKILFQTKLNLHKMKAFYKFLFALVAFVAISVNASAANNAANPFMNKEIVAVTEMTSPVPDTIIERQVVVERTIIYEFEDGSILIVRQRYTITEKTVIPD